MNRKEILVKKNKKLISTLQDCGFTFADVRKMLRNKDIRVDDVVVKDDISLSVGQKVICYYTSNMLEKKYEKVFDDDDCIIVFKHAGIETVGDNGLEKILQARAVHRLDRNTEGLVIFSKNEKSEKILKNAIKNHKIHKFYITEVVGEFDVDKTFNAYLLKDEEKSLVKIFDKPTKNALPISTKIKTLKVGNETSLLQIELLTGRTHQIRAHLAFLGFPIVGDGKYGKNENNKKFKLNHQKLCCFCLKFDFIGLENLNNKKIEKYPNWYVF